MQDSMSHPWLSDRARSFLDSIYKIFALGPLLVILYLVASGHVVNVSAEDQAIVRGFIEWFGTAYSLFLALVLVNVWNQFETVDREFDRELDAVATLYEMTNFTQNAVRANRTLATLLSAPGTPGSFDSIHKRIIEYVEHVITNHQVEHRVPLQYRIGEMILENIGKDISLLANNKRIAAPLITEMFKSLNQSIDIRGDRISHSKERTRDTVKLVAVVSSVVWLLSFFGLVITDPTISIVLIGGVSFVILMVLIIILDLDNPFDGTWKVDLDNWQDFRDRIDPFPHIIFVHCINDNLTEKARNLLGRLPCRLSSLAATRWLGLPWKGMMDRIQARRCPDRDDRMIRWDRVYADQFEAHGYRKFIQDPVLPFVILKLGDDMQVLMNHEETNACRDLILFENMLNTKMTERFEWY